MKLLKYFDTDDGSLPEIEISFSEAFQVTQAYECFFSSGACNAVVDSGHLWVIASQSEISFSGSGDAGLVAAGVVEPFHVVLSGVVGSSCPMPDLGVFVYLCGLTLDYRMGPSWGEPEIQSLLALLRKLRDRGGVVSLPWWPEDVERDFLEAMDRV
jgi:hypothetical protein